MQGFTLFKDVNGKYVTVEEDEVVKALIETKFSVFGMDFECIKALRNEYLNHNGKLPITVDSIKEVFNK